MESKDTIHPRKRTGLLSAQGFLFWGMLALAGQIASLRLIDAGPLVHYQHYRPIPVLLEQHPWPLFLLAIQALLVTGALAVRWAQVKAWLNRRFKPWQLAAIALLFFLPSAAVQRNISLYLYDLIFASFIQLINLANIVLAVSAIPDGSLAVIREKIGRIFGSEAAGEVKTAGVDRLALAAAAWVVVLSAGLGLLAYEWHPHVEDEVAYLYHARILATGAITLPAPPVPESFDLYLMEVKGTEWYAVTPPGWPAILTLGVRLGIPGLVNPLLAGINVLLAFLLLQYLYDRQTARLGVFLLCVSPWYIFLGMSFMTHMATLTCLLAAAVSIEKARLTGKARWGWLAGLAVGISSLIRPLDGLIVGAVIALWAIGVGGRRLKLPALAALALGTALSAALVLPYNQQLTGRLTTFPINAYLDSHYGPGKNDLGFGPNRGYGWPIQPFPGHSPLGALINANLNTFSINTDLFGWSTGSLLFIALALFAQKPVKSDLLMLGLVLANFTPYFFYYFSGGPDFGARYWFLMIIPAIALTVRGIQLLSKKIETTEEQPGGGARVMVAVLLLAALSLVAYIPWRAGDKYHHYLRMQAELPKLAEEYGFGKSLVLIRTDRSHPDYASAAIYNPLDWNADAPVYAWDRSPELREELLKAFPDRTVWIVEGPTTTAGGYRVVEGPLVSQSLTGDSGPGLVEAP
jgi:hypothetical protein